MVGGLQRSLVIPMESKLHREEPRLWRLSLSEVCITPSQEKILRTCLSRTLTECQLRRIVDKIYCIIEEETKNVV